MNQEKFEEMRWANEDTYSKEEWEEYYSILGIKVYVKEEV